MSGQRKLIERHFPPPFRGASAVGLGGKKIYLENDSFIKKRIQSHDLGA